MASNSALTPVLHLVTCGSVDDGKSTLIGRLLAETNSVPIDTLEYARRTRRGGSTIPVGEIDYSLLTDGLEAERAFRRKLRPSSAPTKMMAVPG